MRARFSLIIIYARIKHTCSCVFTCFRSFGNGLNSIQIVIYARITKHTCSYCINLFRSFDDELASIQIVIYARIIKHTFFYCIESSLNARPSPETPSNGNCSKTNICDQYFCMFYPIPPNIPLKQR